MSLRGKAFSPRGELVPVFLMPSNHICSFLVRLTILTSWTKFDELLIQCEERWPRTSPERGPLGLSTVARTTGYLGETTGPS